MKKQIFVGLLLILGLGGWLALTIGSGQPAPTVTYYSHIAGILERNCVTCHSAGGVAPFSLEDPQRVVRMAAAIQYVVENDIMPPWPPGPLSPPMLDERRLTVEEKELILRWVASGAPLGDPSQRPPSSTPPRPSERTPDRIITMDPPYLPSKARSDDYRCFLLDPQLERDTLVTGYRVYPGQKSLVHHVILFVIGPDAVAAAEARDRAEPGPGWTCYGGPGISGLGANALSNSLGFWVPGSDGTDFPHKSARFLRAGSRIIMQVHYHTVHVTQNSYDATQVHLFLAPEGAPLVPLQGMILAAPVEIRCPGPYPSDPNDPCHREAALRRAEPDFALLSDAIHQICGTTVQEYLQREIGDGSVQSTKCDFRVRQNGLALGVVSHMHMRGTKTRIEINPDTPQAKILLDIPRWDFNWQGNYWFQEPIPLKAGDRVRIVCVYDNSRAIMGPDRQMVPPRYMIWGEGTLDEMCLGALAFIRP